MPLSCKKVLRSIRVPSFMTRPAIDACLMLAMAVQAPTHLDLDRAGDTLHSCHAAVAVSTGEASANMHHVRKIDEVRHAVDPDPGDRLFIFPVRHQLFYFRGVLSNEQVAGAAISNRGNAGDCRFWGITMAEETRDSVVTGMLFMTEGDRLDRRAIMKIERQNVHERKDGEKSDKDDEQPADKPRYFHAVCQGKPMLAPSIPMPRCTPCPPCCEFPAGHETLPILP